MNKFHSLRNAKAREEYLKNQNLKPFKLENGKHYKYEVINPPKKVIEIINEIKNLYGVDRGDMTEREEKLDMLRTHVEHFQRGGNFHAKGITSLMVFIGYKSTKYDSVIDLINELINLEDDLMIDNVLEKTWWGIRPDVFHQKTKIIGECGMVNGGPYTFERFFDRLRFRKVDKGKISDYKFIHVDKGYFTKNSEIRIIHLHKNYHKIRKKSNIKSFIDPNEIEKFNN